MLFCPLSHLYQEGSKTDAYDTKNCWTLICAEELSAAYLQWVMGLQHGAIGCAIRGPQQQRSPGRCEQQLHTSGQLFSSRALHGSQTNLGCKRSKCEGRGGGTWLLHAQALKLSLL